MINFSISLDELARTCGAAVIGDGTQMVTGICAIDDLQANALTYVLTENVAKKITDDADIFFLVKPESQSRVINGLCHEQPQQAFRLILSELTKDYRPALIAKTAIISPTAQLGKNVTIGDYAVIHENVVIGDSCYIGCHSVIESDVSIGDNTKIGHRVILHKDTQLGHDCIIAEGAVIGGQGFGFSLEGGQWQAIPQIGRVIIGCGVHIGANSCVDRGAINDTVIGNHVIIDNLVHIAHNVQVGDGTAMAAGVGVAGSTRIGKYCLLAGQVGVVGHISIADGVQVNGGARVLQSIKEGGVYAGSFHAQPAKKWNRITVYVKRLETLFKREK